MDAFDVVFSIVLLSILVLLYIICEAFGKKEDIFERYGFHFDPNYKWFKNPFTYLPLAVMALGAIAGILSKFYP